MTEQANIETIEIVDTNFVQFVFKLQTAIQAGWVVNPDGRGIRDVGARKRAVLIRNVAQKEQVVVKEQPVDVTKDESAEEAKEPKQPVRKNTAKKGE